MARALHVLLLILTVAGYAAAAADAVTTTAEKPKPTLTSAAEEDTTGEGPTAPTPSGGGCPPAPINSVEPPIGSQLYLSVAGNGDIGYPCVNGKPDLKAGIAYIELATGPGNTVPWTGSVEFKDGVPIFFFQSGGNSTEGPTADIEVSSTPTIVSQNSTTNIDYYRWEVTSQDGDSAEDGGLPNIGYVNMVDTDGGLPESTCDGNETYVPLKATFNLYTCEQGYIAAPPPPGGPMPAPMPAPIPAPIPAPLPLPVPAPLPAPKPAPIPVAPTPSIPIPPIVPAPSPATPSSAERVAFSAVMLTAIAALL